MVVSKVKTNTVIQTAINASIKEIVFTVIGAGDITLHLDRLSDENRAYAALHGMKQRIADAAAQSKDPETGLPVSALDKLSAMKLLVEHYESGTKEWRTKTSTRGESGNSLLVQCLMELTGKDRAEMAAFVKSKSPAERTALLKSEKVKPIADRIESQLTAEVDADDLLSELGI